MPSTIKFFSRYVKQSNTKIHPWLPHFLLLGEDQCQTCFQNIMFCFKKTNDNGKAQPWCQLSNYVGSSIV